MPALWCKVRGEGYPSAHKVPALWGDVSISGPRLQAESVVHSSGIVRGWEELTNEVVLWSGSVSLVAVDRRDETALSMNTEGFDIVALVEVLRNMKNQRLADAIVYGLVGQLEAIQQELLVEWGDWQVEREESEK